MRNRLLWLSTLITLPLVAYAQSPSWTDMGGFPDETTFTGALHGLAVDAAGKLWITVWAPGPVWDANGDAVVDTDGNALNLRSIHVFNPDGTIGLPSITQLSKSDGVDLVLNDTNPRGLRADNNGDVVAVFGSSDMFRIDHQTGAVMNHVNLERGSPVAPGISATGDIYVATVVPTTDFPVEVYNADFSRAGVVVADGADGFGRTLEVSADGNTVFVPRYSLHGIIEYVRPDEFSDFNQTNPDTLHRGMIAESAHRNPATGNIWFGHSVAAGVEVDSTKGFYHAPQMLTWYAHDPVSRMLVDSLKYGLPGPFAEEKTRAIAFTPDGNTAYVGLWDVLGAYPSIKKFVRAGTTAIHRDPVAIPHSFTLGQAYPNPFNPQANIEFELKEAAIARLTVHDVLGRKVSTLVDEPLSAGRYTATFTASHLPSGTYLYRLIVAGHMLTGKMVLAK